MPARHDRRRGVCTLTAGAAGFNNVGTSAPSDEISIVSYATGRSAGVNFGMETSLDQSSNTT